jgi:hypothetical protein
MDPPLRVVRQGAVFQRAGLTVEIRIVVAENDVDVLAILIFDEEIGQRGAVWDELFRAS